MDKIKHILEFDQHAFFREHTSMVAAYCNCLSPEESVNALNLSLTGSPTIRRYVLRKIKSDIDAEYQEFHKKMIRDLLDGFHERDHRVRQGVGTCLSGLLEVLPKQDHQLIVSAFLNSKYVPVRRRGYKIIRKEEAFPFDDLVLAWEKFGDSECAWCLVKFADIAWLCSKQDVLAASLLPYQIPQLYIKIAKHDSSQLTALREIDGISYLYALVKLNMPIAQEEALEIFEQNMRHEELGLLIWCLGKKQMWEALRIIESRLPDVDKATREQYGEGCGFEIPEEVLSFLKKVEPISPA